MGRTRDIREAVEAELRFDPLIDQTDITVRNMNGAVALNGTVPSYPQYLEAAAAAQRVAGVREVRNHLEVVLPAGDYRDDTVLTTAANNALSLNVTVPDGIEAAARDGNLTLTGRVRYGAQRGAAEQAVAGLTGVRNVERTRPSSGSTRTRPMSSCWCRTRWTARRWLLMTATSRWTPTGIRCG
jgi:osmotically-inducible protein OsmY